MRRPLPLLLSGLAAVLLVTGPARAGTRSSRVTVTAPARARVNHPVMLLLSGFAARPANELVIYLDDRACASAGKAEGRRPEVKPPTVLKGLSKGFRVKLKVMRSSRGTHYVCSFVENHRTGHTYAHGSGRYVTR